MQPDVARGGNAGWRWVGLALLAFALLATAWLGLPLADWLLQLRQTVQSSGAAGVALFIFVYLVAVMVFAPATVFTVTAGAMWGWTGVPISLAGAWLGSLAAFGLSRGLFGTHSRWVCNRHAGVDKLNRVVESLGWRGVLLARLSPLVPFSMQNYLFGLTRVDNVTFATAGLIGMVPATLVKVWAGAAGSGSVSIDRPTWLLLGAGALATVVAAWLFVRRWRSI